MADNPETLKNIKEKNKEKLNISKSGKVRNFPRVYYEWVRDAKGMYAKTTMEKGVKKLVEGYEKYTGSDVKVQKNPGDPGTTLSKIDLEETYNIDKYISFVGQLMLYTTKVGPDVENAANELAVIMSHPGPEHWKTLGLLIGYLKAKENKGIVVRKPKVLKYVMFCDLDYDTDKETRKSVSGLVATLAGTLLTC